MAEQPAENGQGGSVEGSPAGAADAPAAETLGSPEPFEVVEQYLRAVSVASSHLGVFDRCEIDPERGPVVRWGRSKDAVPRPMAMVLRYKDCVVVEIEHQESPTFYTLYGHVVLSGFPCDLVDAANFDADDGGGEPRGA